MKAFLFLDEHVPPTIAGAITGATVCGRCVLCKALVEDKYKEAGWFGRLKKAPTGGPAYTKNGKKWKAQQSESEEGNACAYLLTPPVEYGGRLRPVVDDKQCDPASFTVSSGGEQRKLDAVPVGEKNILDGTAPGLDTWGEMHDLILVGIGAGWRGPLDMFGWIQDDVTRFKAAVTLHVTCDAAEYMQSTMRRAYKDVERRKQEQDEIRRYALIVDDPKARGGPSTEARIAEYVANALEVIARHPDERLLKFLLIS